MKDVAAHIDPGCALIIASYAIFNASSSSSFLPPAITSGTGQAATCAKLFSQ
jgi:hypothetical protein